MGCVNSEYEPSYSKLRQNLRTNSAMPIPRQRPYQVSDKERRRIEERQELAPCKGSLSKVTDDDHRSGKSEFNSADPKDMETSVGIKETTAF